MSGTRRRTRVHQSETWRFTAEVVETYRQMKLRPRADDEWKRMHNLLADLLQTPPNIWPVVYHHGEKFQTEIQALIEEALLERSEVDSVRLFIDPECTA